MLVFQLEFSDLIHTFEENIALVHKGIVNVQLDTKW